MISRQELNDVKKDYLDKVMIRDGSEESKKTEQILSETCDAFIEDIIKNFRNRATIEGLFALTLLTLGVIEEELTNEAFKKIARKVVSEFSVEIINTFFREQDGTR